MTKDKNIWCDGVITFGRRDGWVLWEVTVYHKRSFWLNKKLGYKSGAELSKEAAQDAISAFVERTSGIKGYRPC